MVRYIRRNIRLLSNYRKGPYLQFYRILGFYPDNIAYYELAIRHRSVTPPTSHGHALSNERLEFLGDAVLNSVVTDILFRRYQNKREGFLTNTRSKIVNRDFLNKIAIEIGLEKLVKRSRHFSGSNSTNIYGNAFEALIGAVYLDYGYKQCKKFVEKRLFREFVILDQIIDSEQNYKSKIIEYCQKYQLRYEFQLIEDSLIQPGCHLFRTALLIENQEICQGTGSSKKDSQQQVSLLAWQKIQEDDAFLT